MSNFTIQVRPQDQQDRDSFIEFVRTKKDTLLDEVYVRKITHNVNGVEILFDYERFGNRLRELPPAQVSAQEWAASRAFADAGKTADEKRQLFAQSPLAERLFAEGARHYNEKSRQAEEDFMADAAFIDSLKSGQ